MNRSSFSVTTADVRQTGVRCVHCQTGIALGDRIVVCSQCNALQHERCFEMHDRCCGSYECAPARRTLAPHLVPTMSISATEIESAAIPVSRRPIAWHPCIEEPTGPQRLNKLAVASFFVALAGIPLFGLITGLIAVLLGCFAVGGIRSNRLRGNGFALTGILLGIGDIVGWCFILAFFFIPKQHTVKLSEFEPDPTMLENLAPYLRGPMHANALILSQPKSGLFSLGTAFGSGVILQINNASALVVTNRHVVDPNFSDNETSSQPILPADGSVQVKLVGQPIQQGHVIWMAPDGIDLALVRVEVNSPQPKAVPWKRPNPLLAGEEVFTIGNPQHLDWSLTRGVISQFRLRNCGTRSVRLIQTDAALNPGNSGGGLYDKEGVLIGINTLAGDKRVAEGINFAIAIESLLNLHPPALDQADAPNPNP